MRGINRLICILFSLVVPAATAGPVSAEGVKVGIILPLTGTLAMPGRIERNSYLLAAQEINAQGGVKGKKIEILMKDTVGKPVTGLSAVRKLTAQENVVVVCGGISSSVVWKAAASAQEEQTPFVVNTASADRITEQAGNISSG